MVQFSSVQSLSRVWLFATPWTTACQDSLSITNSRSLLKLVSIEWVMPSNNLILCRPLLLPPSIFPSIRVFSNESLICIRWPKYWSFNFSISPSNDYSGLISFRIDWFDLAIQGTLKGLLQNQSSKAPILQWSAFFMVQHFVRFISRYFILFDAIINMIVFLIYLSLSDWNFTLLIVSRFMHLIRTDSTVFLFKAE